MRILVWNVNGIAATKANICLSSRFKTISGFLSHFGDIACFQESKLQSDKLTKDLACPGHGWESFWAISRCRKDRLQAHFNALLLLLLQPS